MTATDELRRLLDERGVEWWAEDGDEEPPYYPPYYFVTKWFANGCEQTYEEIPAIRSRQLTAFCVSPEQAVEATLGRGTCRDMGRYCFTCSECGWIANEPHHMLGGFHPSYCPNCGAKVVDE